MQEEDKDDCVISDDEDKVADEEILGKPKTTQLYSITPIGGGIETTKNSTTPDMLFGKPSELSICCICMER